MAIEFPQNPANGEEFTSANKTWIWFSGVNAWTLVSPTLDDIEPPFLIDNLLPAEIPLRVRGAVGQFAPLFQLQDAAALVLFSVDEDGNLDMVGNNIDMNGGELIGSGMLPLTGGVITGAVSNTPIETASGVINLAANNNFNLTPIGAIEISFTGGVAGQSGFLYVDNSGDETITWDAAILFPGGEVPELVAGLHQVGYYFTGGSYLVTSAVEFATA